MNFIFRLKLLSPSLETTHKYERIKTKEHREIKTKQSILQVRKNKFTVQISSDWQWLTEKVATKRLKFLVTQMVELPFHQLVESKV